MTRQLTHQPVGGDDVAAGAAGTAVGPRQPSKARRRTTEYFLLADTGDDWQVPMKSS